MKKFKFIFEFENVPDDMPPEVILQATSKAVLHIPEKYCDNEKIYQIVFDKFEKHTKQ